LAAAFAVVVFGPAAGLGEGDAPWAAADADTASAAAAATNIATVAWVMGALS
jgi:hypothetical protein